PHLPHVLSLHDALPIWCPVGRGIVPSKKVVGRPDSVAAQPVAKPRVRAPNGEPHRQRDAEDDVHDSREAMDVVVTVEVGGQAPEDRKSTRLNSSHEWIS